MAVILLRRKPWRATLLFAAVVAAVALFAVVRSTGPAHAVSGNPYAVDVVVDTNPDPKIVETTIVADEATIDVGNGKLAHVEAFNGTVPGPEFRLNVDQSVTA